MTSPSGPGDAVRVDDGFFAEINGVPQWMTLRGDDRANPALLLIAGPGAAFSPMAPLFAPWEADFTVAQWDQPGAGATFARHGDLAPMTYARLIADGLAVAEETLRRLGQQRLVLMATSGGTVVALGMIRARPDLFRAYVGNGQIVHWGRQEAHAYAIILERARAAGDGAAIAEIEALGPPPWNTTAEVAVKSKYANAMTDRERAYMGGPGAAAMAPPPSGARYLPDPRPTHDPMAQSMRVFDALKGELEAFDARAGGLAFAVPMVILQGAEDAHTTTADVADWFADIQAPSKSLDLIEGAGHASLFLIPEILALLRARLDALAVGP